MQLLGAVALQVIEYPGDLRGDRLGQPLRRVFGRQGSDRAAVLVRRVDEGTAQRFGEQLVVEAVGEIHHRGCRRVDFLVDADPARLTAGY